jgi:hypothetical protein
MNPQLQRFFDVLATAADIRRLVTTRREEDLHLEFKQKSDRSTGDLGDDDRKNFSKAVSGFANAEGGVLIFGVRTRSTRERPDRASQLKPITDVGRFRVALLDSLLNTTQPPVDGVRIEVIQSRGRTGYVKCLIPDSEKPPHRAVFADRHYYRSTSTGFRVMEHYELEDMFGRRLRPLLRLGVNFTQAGFPPREGLSFYLLNVGRGVAKHAGFHCSVTDPQELNFDGIVGLQNVTAENAGRASLSYYNQLGVVHPNGIRSGVGQALFVGKAKGLAVTMNLIWYAENMLARRQTLTLELGAGGELEGSAALPP